MRHSRQKERTIMRDMSQFSVRFFKFDGPKLQLFDQVSDAYVVCLIGISIIASGTIYHDFLSLVRHGSPAAEAGRLHAGTRLDLIR